MRTRLLSIAIVSVLSVGAQAQLPSERFSAINYIGRFTGFGYSDGYHSCKDERRSPVASLKQRESWSTTHGAPTAPPSSNMMMRPTSASQQYAQQVQLDASPSMPSTNLPQALPLKVQTVQPLESQPPGSLPPESQSSPSDFRKMEPVPARRNDFLPAPSSVPQSSNRPALIRNP